MSTAAPSARERIMIAAVELAGQSGVHRVTMSAVAARAEVSRPTLCSYFPDVAHVLQAWVDREVSQLQARLQAQARLRPDVDVDLLAGLVVTGITSVTLHVVSGRLAALEARRRLLDLLLHGALASGLHRRHGRHPHRAS